MKTHIVWQGRAIETDAATVADFLAGQGVDPSQAVVEWKGEAYAPGDDLSGIALEENCELAAFRVVAGG